MCQISIGFGRDFFEQLQPSYIKNIVLRKKIDWILYYLQITKGFTMPNIDFFYENKITKNEFALYCENKEIFREKNSNIKSFDIFENMLFEIFFFLSNNSDILLNDDSYEFYLENYEFYQNNNEIFKNISKEKCKTYLKKGKSIIFRKEIAQNKNIPNISHFDKEELIKIIKSIFLFSNEDLKESLEILEQLENNNYIVPHLKAEIATKMGNIDIADKLIKECSEKYSYYKEIMYLSATYFLSRENPYKFNQIIKKAKELYPNDIMFDFILAKMYSYLEDDETAEKIINNLKIDENQLFPGILLDLSIINNNFLSSEKLLLQALSMNERHFPALITLSNLYLNNNMFENALNTIEKAISLYPQYSECYEIKGEILKNLGRTEEAESSFKKAIIIEQLKS